MHSTEGYIFAFQCSFFYHYFDKNKLNVTLKV